MDASDAPAFSLPPPLRLLTGARPDDPVAEMTCTERLLRAVAAGERPPSVRVFTPGPTLAFGRLDALAPGYDAARQAAIMHGFTPVLRVAGGRAAAYHEGAVLIEVVMPSASIAAGIEARFAWLADVLVAALGEASVSARVGELPGEFCPGRFSVHAGTIKLAGVAQRAIRGAALVTAAVAVQGGDRLRAVLVDVQDALGVDWDPGTAGSADALAPAITPQSLRELLIRQLPVAQAER